MSVGQMLTKSDRWPGKIGRTAKIGLILAVSCKRPLNNYGETSTPKGDTDAHLLGTPTFYAPISVGRKLKQKECSQACSFKKLLITFIRKKI